MHKYELVKIPGNPGNDNSHVKKKNIKLNFRIIRQIQQVFYICITYNKYFAIKLKRLRMKDFWYAFLLMLILFGCKKHEPSGIYDNGRIEYRITYLENNSNQISPNLLPKKMKLEFNQDYSINIIEGFMGVFKLNNITYFRHKRCSTLLEVLNKNYVYLGKRGEEMCCFENMNDMTIESTAETRTIAGLDCNKAIVSLGESGESFEVFYTNEIKLEDPNMTNPYKQIDGVLLEFQLSLSGLKMKFTAEKFESQIDNSIKAPAFPKNSNEVTRDQMSQIISRLVD